MFNRIKAILTQIFTENDNKTYCAATVGGYGFAFVLAATYFIMFIWTTIKSGVFDLSVFSGGAATVGGVLTNAAIGVKLKVSNKQSE